MRYGNQMIKYICLFLFCMHVDTATAAEPVTWRDLTISIPPQADPFYGLDYDSRIHLETLIKIEKEKRNGKPIDANLAKKGETALMDLRTAGFDRQQLIEKYHDLPLMIERQRTELREDILGKKIKIPGYVVPLEIDGLMVKQFFLVPYAGACIHTPPPPSNQIILVSFSEGIPLDSMDQPYVVEGLIQVDGELRGVGLADGQTEFEVGYKLEASRVIRYRM